MKTKRIRGTTLQNIRKAHFHKHPLCVMCQEIGRVTIAQELDHILALHLGGTDTEDNRAGLCKECHLKKSKQERGHEYHHKVTIGLDGYQIEK